ncbi:hypothetical protein [Leptolyngbya ohadii]|uniref:hypothetical protein n=1 Tax=Leptolyngbya ohadii TaxID=1962290 RepID=UPI000B599C4B|nr:hypothetical protein [Leptolyngbya ohadii]
MVLDIRSRLFSKPLFAVLPAAGETASALATIAQPHLLILDWSEELLGIRLEAPPVLRRVARSAFAPIPPTYLVESGIRCVSALVKPSETEPPLFFLNLEQLLSVRSLPATSPPS